MQSIAPAAFRRFAADPPVFALASCGTGRHYSARPRANDCIHPPMPDARITAALNHWAPRFIANGVPYVDFQEVTAGLERWEDWCAAWSARGAIHEALGRTAFDEGRSLSAAEHLSTAAVCYHFGK